MDWCCDQAEDDRIAVGVRSLNSWLKRTSGGMSLIVPGLYVGSLRDALDVEQLRDNKITDIVSVHDLSRAHPQHQHLRVLRVRISDRPESNLIEHIAAVNSFIHLARLEKRNILVHCLAGVSRSVSFVIAYLVTVTDMSHSKCVRFVAERRCNANPNFGFRMQLARFADNNVLAERCRLQVEATTAAFAAQFEDDCKAVKQRAQTAKTVHSPEPRPINRHHSDVAIRYSHSLRHSTSTTAAIPETITPSDSTMNFTTKTNDVSDNVEILFIDH